MKNASAATLGVTSRNLRFVKFATLTVLAACASAPSTHADSATWAAGSTGAQAWSTSANWSTNPNPPPGSLGTTTNTDTATFSSTGATIAVDSGRNIANMNFTSGTWLFNGFPLILSAGGSITSVAGSGLVTTTSATSLTLEGNYTLSNNSANGMNISGATLSGGAAGTYNLTLGGTFGTINPATGILPTTGSASAIYGVISNGSATQLGLVKTGTGVWLLKASNTYTGPTFIDGGSLDVLTMGTEGTGGGVASSIGSSSNAAGNLMINGGTIQYSGNGVNSGGVVTSAVLTTDRLFTIGDGNLSSGIANTATIDSSNVPNTGYNSTVATMNFTNTGAVAFYGGNTGVHGLILQGNNVGNNFFGLQITDQNTGAGATTSLTKNGAGTWALTNSNNYSGQTQINGGTLRDQTGTGLSSNSALQINDGVYETGTTFSRSFGTGAGNIQILGGAPGSIGSGSSGLSANGANTNFTLNAGSMQWGSANFAPKVFILNGYAANANLTLNDSIDLNGGNRTIANYGNGTTATITGTISNSSSTAASLGKTGNGTLVLTQADSYDGGTYVNGGILDASVAGSLGSGNAFVSGNAELRLDSATALAAGKTVTSNGGIVGESFNATQSQLASTIASGSTGAIAIDGTQSNALNMSALGNGQMYLGSVKGGTYSATSLTVAGGTQHTQDGTSTMGGTYLLGAGGGTLTITGTNVLTDQTPVLLLPNPNNQLQTTFANTTTGTQLASTTNTSNSVTIGDATTAGQPNGGGTVDLQAAQNYTGYTTINAGGNFILDYTTSGTGAVGNMISSSSPVVFRGGSLTVKGGANASDTQSFNSVNLSQGLSTVTATSGAGGSSTLNLGNLTFGNASAPTGSTKTGGGSLVITGSTGTVTENNPALLGPESTAQKTIGAGGIAYNNGGTYFWAATSSGSGPYTVTNYTSEATLSTAATNATTDYLMSANVIPVGSETMNLLRVNSTNTGATLSLNTGNNKVTTNGILYTGAGNFNFNGNPTGGLTSSTGTLYIDNYGTGALLINTSINGTTDVVYNGNGNTIARSGGGFALTDSYSGNTYINNVIIQLAQNTNSFGTGTGTIFFNSGAGLTAPGDTSGLVISQHAQWNGNISLGRSATGPSTTGPNFNNGVTLANNITVTINTSGFGTWTVSSILSDGGYGNSLTIGANSLQFKDNGSITNQLLAITGTTTMTGNFIILGDGITFGNAASLNRNNEVIMAANTTVSFNTNGFAGLQDAGAANANENVIAGALTLWGSGNYSFGGTISGTTSLNMSGAGGTQTITDSNTNTGAITANAGTLLIDNSQGGAFTGTNALSLGGGTLGVKGATGGTTQSFSGTTMNIGNSTIMADNSNGGGTTINLGTFAGNATVGATLDLVAKGGTAPTFNTSTTALNTVNGAIIGSVVYTGTNGVTTWATETTTGSSPFAITAYTGDTTNLVMSAGTSTVNYQLTGSQTQTGNNTVGLLRVTNAASGSLNLNSTSLQVNGAGLLWNGTDNFSVTGGTIKGLSGKDLIIQNYGTTAGKALTIGAVIADNTTATALVLSGPGKTVLTASNTYSGVTYLNGPGIVNFNQNGNFGSGTAGITFSGATLQYATGTSSDLSTSGHPVTFNAGGGTIDTNANNVTFSNAGTFGSGVGGMTVVDSAGGGSLKLASKTGYAGSTIIKNGGDLILGTTGDLTTGLNTIVGNGGTLQGGAKFNSAATPKAGTVVLQSGGVIAPGAGLGTQVIQGTGLSGSFNGSMSTSTDLNVLTMSTLTFNPGGTIKFELDSTIGDSGGNALTPSASTQINLGTTGALVKGNTGVGQFILDFGNTGTYDTSGITIPGSGADPVADAGANVYDLINFGATSLTGGLDGNTNFNIDDFTIKNLNGVGTLSFWYNASTNQEELLLTVVPEPSTWAMLIGGLATLIFWTRKRAARRPVVACGK